MSKVVDVVMAKWRNMMMVIFDDCLRFYPLAFFPKLLNASQAQLDNWQLVGDGEGIHWPDLDEDLSAASLIKGGMPCP
jgi:hypothetical protein